MFLESAVVKVGKMAQLVIHTSPAKIRSTFTGNKKQALEVEHATTPTPQNYTNGNLIIGGPTDLDHPSHWDEYEDMASFDDGNAGEGNQISIQTDTSYNLVDHLMDKGEKINNLYSSLLEVGNFVQALSAGRGIEEAQENQNITRCMTGLANALLSQPYRVIMDQQAELLQAINEISRSVMSLVKKVDTNEKKVELI